MSKLCQIYNPQSLQSLTANKLMVIILHQYREKKSNELNKEILNLENVNYEKQENYKKQENYEHYLASLNFPFYIQKLILERYNLAKIIYKIT